MRTLRSPSGRPEGLHYNRRRGIDGIQTTRDFAAVAGYLSSIAVAKGDLVARGQVIAASGPGHPGTPIPHVHFGARFGGAYINPMLLLMPLDFSPLIHLGPLPATPS